MVLNINFKTKTVNSIGFNISIKDIDGEIWKTVDKYKGYAISNKGRIKSLNRRCKSPNGGRSVKERILSPSSNRDGYLMVMISINGIKSHITIHKLVATTFCPNPDNLPCVSHEDDNKLNNNDWNLKWCTHQYNALHNGMIYKNQDKAAKSLSIPIIMEYNDGTKVEYKSACECARQNSLNDNHINRCCRGLIKQYKGFKFYFKYGHLSLSNTKPYY